MATYTLTASPEQDALIQWLVKNYNTQHETQLDAQAFISLQLAAVLAPFAESFKETILAQVVDVFSKADPSTQAQVRALLKLP